MCVLMADELSGVGEIWIQGWQGIGVSNVGSWKCFFSLHGDREDIMIETIWNTYVVGMSKVGSSKKNLYGGFQKLGVPQNGWFRMENPTKWMILWYP